MRVYTEFNVLQMMEMQLGLARLKKKTRILMMPMMKRRRNLMSQTKALKRKEKLKHQRSEKMSLKGRRKKHPHLR